MQEDHEKLLLLPHAQPLYGSAHPIIVKQASPRRSFFAVHRQL